MAPEETTALAVGAHPDDVEFMMAGTLLLLKRAGADIHIWSLANGSCGTGELSRDEIIRLRWEEARKSAELAGAALHRPMVDDLAIFYEPGILSRVAAVIREVKPDILFVPYPEDYMEDHSITARLVTTAAFARGMPNFTTSPPVQHREKDTVLYHAMPYGLSDAIRRPVTPEIYVDVGEVIDTKRAMLRFHRTQAEWLARSQDAGSPEEEMERMCAALGRMSGCFELAEGWTRHSHLGFSASPRDPLGGLLGPVCRTDPDF